MTSKRMITKQLHSYQKLPLTSMRYEVAFRGQMCVGEVGKGLRNRLEFCKERSQRHTMWERTSWLWPWRNRHRTDQISSDGCKLEKIIHHIPSHLIRGDKVRPDGLVMQNRMGCMLRVEKIEKCKTCEASSIVDWQKHLMIKCTEIQAKKPSAESQDALCRFYSYTFLKP